MKIYPIIIGSILQGEPMSTKFRSVFCASALIQCTAANAIPSSAYKALFLLGTVVMNGIPGVNGHIGEICPINTKTKTMNGVYLLEERLPKDPGHHEHHGEHTTDYLYSDEDCLLPLNHSLDFLDPLPGDRITNLEVKPNHVIDPSNALILNEAGMTSKGSEYWNRAAVVINSSMNLDTADRVMERSSAYFDAVSRGLLTMDHQVISVNGTPSCSLPENYRNFYQDAQNQGFNLDSFNKVTFIADFPCDWGGVAFVGGRLSAIQAYGEDAALAVEIHESGHLNKGGHASTEELEYGDHNDPLGNGYNHVRFNAPHLEQFGFLRGDEIQHINTESYGTYELRNLDDIDNNQDELQVLRISRYDEPTVFVSFRNKVSNNYYSKELKKPYVVEIHTHEGKTGEHTILRERLSEGDTYCIGQSGTLLRVESVDANYANVELFEYVSPSDGPTSAPSPAIRGTQTPSPSLALDQDWCPYSPSKSKKIDPLILYPSIGAGAVLLTGGVGLCVYYSKKNKK